MPKGRKTTPKIILPPETPSHPVEVLKNEENPNVKVTNVKVIELFGIKYNEIFDPVTQVTRRERLIK